MIAGKKLIVVLGPTAVGKTALSVSLAQHFNTEIISADSRQFYRELNIGVARPSLQELNAAPHHFISFIGLQEDFSAGRFETEALNLLGNLFNDKDHVICCGGSMLYIDALINGLDDLPSDKNLKIELENLLEEKGLEVLLNELHSRDPEYWEQVDRSNPHRIIRAVEVCRLTGKKFSELRKSSPSKRPFQTIKIGLHGDRDWIYDRINRRVDKMMEIGLDDEARAVIQFRDQNALNTVGYKELFEFLDGNCSREEAITKIKQHTRNFAKRQLTWWRRDDSIQWIDAQRSQDLLAEALKLIP